MKKKIGYFSFVAFALAALYMMVPACGSKGNNNNNVAPYGYNPYGGGGYGGYGCQPGQYCNTGGSGVPLLNGPATSTISANGSIAQLQFGGTNVVAGQIYNGPVVISGMLQIAPGGACPPGQYQVQGQGTWQGGYGGTYGRVTATLQIAGGYGGGMQGQINVLVYGGQDPNIQVPTMYYMTGNFATSCDPTGVAM